MRKCLFILVSIFYQIWFAWKKVFFCPFFKKKIQLFALTLWGSTSVHVLHNYSMRSPPGNWQYYNLLILFRFPDFLPFYNHIPRVPKPWQLLLCSPSLWLGQFNFLCFINHTVCNLSGLAFFFIQHNSPDTYVSSGM